jgi:hypothetical protein
VVIGQAWVSHNLILTYVRSSVKRCNTLTANYPRGADQRVIVRDCQRGLRHARIGVRWSLGLTPPVTAKKSLVFIGFGRGIGAINPHECSIPGVQPVLKLRA